MRTNTRHSIGSTWRRLRRLLPISFAVALTLSLGTVDAWAKTNAAPPATAAPVTSVAETRAQLEEMLPFPLVTALNDDLVEYAQREAEATSLDDFRGGDVVVIGGATLTVVLLVLLVLVLL
jgi:hypothetical protein